MENHVGLMEARLLTIDGKYIEAVEKLRDVRGKSPFAEHNFNQVLIDLEMCYCYAQAGQIEVAIAAFQGLDFSCFIGLDTDEQIVALWMRSKLCQIDERFGRCDDLRQELLDLQEKHASTCAALKSNLSQFIEQ